MSATFEGRETEPVPTTTDVHILLNGTSLVSGYVNGFGPTSDLTFSVPLNLNAGDHIDFAVGFGSNGNFLGDTTGLDATISSVPEPSGLVLLLFGSGALALVRRRRNDQAAERPGRIRTRAVKAVEADLRINRGLWELAERFSLN